MSTLENANQKSAAPSSFYSAMRILPEVQRDAMFLIYSFCRKVDDIADSDMPRDERSRGLDQWRADINALYDGTRAPKLADYVPVIKQFGLRRDDFLAIIDGMAMDAAEDIRAPDLAKLDLYCDRVASAVGRLSVKVFGLNDPDGIALAHHLGRALQLTNILRDLDEDAAIGRLYLSGEALADAGIDTREPARAVLHPGIGAACAPLVARAREHFAQAGRIMDLCSRPVVRSPRLMATVYRGILDELVRRGFTPPRTRVRISRSRLLLTILRHGVF